MARFTDRSVLVTGGGSGLGRAIARAFATEGAAVVVSGRTAGPLDETVELIRAEGGRAAAVRADTTDAEQSGEPVRRAEELFGGLHIAVNSAGILRAGHAFGDLPPAALREMMETNVLGLALAMQAEIAHMRAHGGGAIVNIASTLGAHRRLPGMAGYLASKAAVSALTRAAALDHIAEGIRINAVSPGPADTAMSLRPGESPADRDARLRQASPLGRVSSTREIAAAVLYLASDDAASVVGTDLVVDGGSSA